MITISSPDCQKSNLNSTSKELRIKVETLTEKLKNLRKNEPRTGSQNRQLIKSSEKKNNSFIKNQTQAESKDKQKQGRKAKINWNTSATCWTRDKSPSHSIPKTNRFPNHTKQSNDFFPELYINLRTNIKKNGVSFARSARKQLFKSQMTTPSPQKYNKKRYLDNLMQSPRKFIKCSISSEEASNLEHISGGTIGKFSKYENLYYPHTKKLPYNQKEIHEAYQSRASSQAPRKILDSI